MVLLETDHRLMIGIGLGCLVALRLVVGTHRIRLKFLDNHSKLLEVDEMDESEKKARKTAARDQASEKAADILLKIRRERNLSQVQLAQVSGRKQSYISRVESRQQNISLGTLQEIVNAVDGELVIDVKL